MKIYAAASIAVWTGAALARTDVRVDSTKPSLSADGTRALIVDRISAAPASDAESGAERLKIRLTDSQGTATRQRTVEVSAARSVEPAIWIDSRWAAFVYNVQKNSNGMVYYDSENNHAVLAEIVALSRRMGATGKIETELTSVDVIDYGSTVTRTRNVTHNGGSVFPVFVKQVPVFQGKPFADPFRAQLEEGINAYREFCKARASDGVKLEQASESFSDADDHMAILAGIAGKPALVLISLKSANAVEALRTAQVIVLGPEVALSCMSENADSSNPEAAGQETYSRLTTGWRDDTHALVQREVFDTDNDKSSREELYVCGLDGSVQKLATAKPSPSVPRATTKPVTGERATDTTTPAVATRPSRVSGRVRTQDTTAAAEAASEPTPVKHTTPRPRVRSANTPTPSPTPSPPPTAKSRLNLLRRLIPGHRDESPAATP